MLPVHIRLFIRGAVHLHASTQHHLADILALLAVAMGLFECGARPRKRGVMRGEGLGEGDIICLRLRLAARGVELAKAAIAAKLLGIQRGAGLGEVLQIAGPEQLFAALKLAVKPLAAGGDIAVMMEGCRHMQKLACVAFFVCEELMTENRSILPQKHGFACG
jgi:hypothetical protein